MQVIRYPKTRPTCERSHRIAGAEFVTSAPDFKVMIRMHCGCGCIDQWGHLHEDDVLLLLGTMAKRRAVATLVPR
jgi:hypothetical protein